MTQSRLNRRLALETHQRVEDGAGGFVRGWVAIGEVWAEVSPLSARETVAGTAGVSVGVTQVVVRGAPVGDPQRPRPDQRFREGERIYRIISVTEHDNRGHYLRCKTEEEVVT